MIKHYLSGEQLAALRADEHGVLPARVYSLRGPVPQMLLVTAQPGAPAAGPIVRTVTMTPLSWGPYTMAISVPLDDTVVTEALSVPAAHCVLAEPTRGMLRQLTICSLRLPAGLSEADTARLKLVRSLYVDVPSILDCPLNMECYVEHTETYHGCLIAFLRVAGGSIDDSILFWRREQVTALFPTNDVDSVVDEHGYMIKRAGLMGDLLLCPTFPCAPKRGWYATFEIWLKDLRDEAYLQPQECEKALAWHARWLEVFADRESPDRLRLQPLLTELCRLIAGERWDDLHSFMAGAQR